MCKETLQGLSYFHLRGKMHRDVKVSYNIQKLRSIGKQEQ